MKKYHYVYIIKDNINHKNYIGMRSCTCLPKEDTKYWSSSKHLKEIMHKVGLHNFSKEILSIWETRHQALAEEVRLHETHDVANNEQFYNLAKQTSTGFTTSDEIHKKSVKIRKRNGSYEKQKTLLKKIWSNKTDIEKEEHSQKMIDVFSQIDTAARSAKSAQTKKTTILENGKTLMQTTIEKSSNTMKENGWYEKLSEQQSIRQQEILENGLSRAQNSRKKQYENQLQDVDENGFNAAQRAAFKYHENLRNTFDDKTGLSKAELRILKLKTTIKEKGLRTGSKNNNAKHINIYNASNTMVFSCYGNFSKICECNNLPQYSLVTTYKNNSKISKGEFEGWYARIIKSQSTQNVANQ